MLTGVGAGGGGQHQSQSSHCLTLMSMLERERSPDSHVPTTDVVSALKREKLEFSSAARPQNLARNPETSLETIYWVVEMKISFTLKVFYFDVLIRVLKSFVAEKGSLNNFI